MQYDSDDAQSVLSVHSELPPADEEPLIRLDSGLAAPSSGEEPASVEPASLSELAPRG